MPVLLAVYRPPRGRPRKTPRAVRLAASLLLGCAPAREGPAGSVDDLGDPLPPPAARARVVSLSPATTELLFALGAGDRLVGRTRWDAWPEGARRVPDLGDGIRPSIEAILASRPDLVVLYASGENRDAARALRDAGIAVISLRIDRIADFERAAGALGDALGLRQAAAVVVDSVRATLDRVRDATNARERPTVFLHAWEAPLVAIGGGSYLSELVEIAGGRNIFADSPEPSPQVSFEEVLRRDPDYVLGGPVALRTMRDTPRWQALKAVREGRLLVLDTALAGRPGVRLGEAAASIARLLHPGVVP